LPDLGPEKCIDAIDGAVRAALGLRKMTGKARGELLMRWFSLVTEATEDLAAIITAENGKTLAEARGEVAYAADFLNWFSGAARRIDGSVGYTYSQSQFLLTVLQVIQASSSANRVITMKQPVGVVSIVTPWNFPAAMITRKVGAAIAAGCPCVVKPAAETPLTALALAELAQRAGLPAGALSIITTLKNTVEVGEVLTQHPDVRKFSFTRSTAVGKLLASQCTSTVKRVSLELGGNAPFVVFDDANIEKATEDILTSKFRLSGQTCVCANRVYVQAGIYEALAAFLVKKVGSFRLGPGMDPKSTHGPLINKQAVSKVSKHVQDAVNLGAKAVVGGKPARYLGEAFFELTVLVDVPSDALCAKEETFGPLLPLIKFETEKDAIELANNTPFGLAGYFFTENLSRAWRVAEAIEVGMVCARSCSEPSSYVLVLIGIGGSQHRSYQRCCFALWRH
jgi:succinate-semialdehyde dehydrogenase / glutarate-semialdehyde dehydrogenase